MIAVIEFAYRWSLESNQVSAEIKRIVADIAMYMHLHGRGIQRMWNRRGAYRMRIEIVGVADSL